MGLLLLNDHILKATWPGWLTGKLSDVAWMVITPVLLAALLSLARLPDRWAKMLGLLGAVGFFTLLQLYPPLGEAITAVIGGSNVPDPTDLFALPAALLAPLCWRPTAPRAYAIPLALGACLASSLPSDHREPCSGVTDWDPNRPLVLYWGESPGGTPADTPALYEALHIVSEHGEEVEFAVQEASYSTVLICPLGGLQPETTYTWWLDAFEDHSVNQASLPGFAHHEERTFRTTAEAIWPLVEQPRDCVAEEDAWYLDHEGCSDTGGW